MDGANSPADGPVRVGARSAWPLAQVRLVDKTFWGSVLCRRLRPHPPGFKARDPAQQTAPGDDGGTRVGIVIRGRVDDVVNRGGVDPLRFSVWDDGQELDFKVLDIPIGRGGTVTVRLGFDGRYAIEADGIGIAIMAGSEAHGERVFDLDPPLRMRRCRHESAHDRDKCDPGFDRPRQSIEVRGGSRRAEKSDQSGLRTPGRT